MEWSKIVTETSGAPRVVFFSINGGVGCSTALAASAWLLAQRGKRVLTIDLNLDSPGQLLLPLKQHPKYGIVDWLALPHAGQNDDVLDAMIASINPSRDGRIYVVPAHGVDTDNYIETLCRVSVGKTLTANLQKLLLDLEMRIHPDIIFIDSRAGINELASICVTKLGANLILLFASNSAQNWIGYEILFKYWLHSGVAEQIRERLQIVASFIPKINTFEYANNLRERAYDLFLETLYDEVSADDFNGFNFNSYDEMGPHYPWHVRWSDAVLMANDLYETFKQGDHYGIDYIFGNLANRIVRFFDLEKRYDALVETAMVP